MPPQFVWASRDASPPGRWDLRLIGWEMLVPGEDAIGDAPWLFDCRPSSRWSAPQAVVRPGLVAAVGADDSQERGELLAAGFGEALSSRVALVELAARLTRLTQANGAMPRHRHAGPVRLDLFHRDGCAEGRWIGMHPREFALLWRLAETPGETVSRGELLRDVWRLDFDPETNSLEVHVSRLRAKLAVCGLAWLVETDPDGGYRLGRGAHSSFTAFARARRESEELDRDYRFGHGIRRLTILETSPNAAE